MPKGGQSKQAYQVSHGTRYDTGKRYKKKDGSEEKAIFEPGDCFYLDTSEGDHLEVFDKNGNPKFVIQLDGDIAQGKINFSRNRKYEGCAKRNF